MAQVTGTTPDRVAVQTLHQHDAPRCDFYAEELLGARGLGRQRYDSLFARTVIDRTAAALGDALSQSRPVTHLGVGQARVEKVASNRRILGDDGTVRMVRYSATNSPEAIAAPEGVIDPFIKLLSFWDGETPVASITYYATHPQSYYGKGDVTAEFVGLARAQREKALPGMAHIHFNGASGNVTAGKYNDGSPAMRPVLTERLATGMRQAWEATARMPISATDVEWRIKPVQLPVGQHLDRDMLWKTLDDSTAKADARFQAATAIAWVERTRAGHAIDLACLRLGTQSSQAAI